MARAGSLKAELLTPELVEFLNRLNTIAAEHGETLVSLSLKWILAQKGVTSVLVGARTPEQLKESLRCVESPLDEGIELPRFPHKIF